MVRVRPRGTSLMPAKFRSWKMYLLVVTCPCWHPIRSDPLCKVQGQRFEVSSPSWYSSTEWSIRQWVTDWNIFYFWLLLKTNGLEWSIRCLEPLWLIIRKCRASRKAHTLDQNHCPVPRLHLNWMFPCWGRLTCKLNVHIVKRSYWLLPCPAHRTAMWCWDLWRRQRSVLYDQWRRVAGLVHETSKCVTATGLWLTAALVESWDKRNTALCRSCHEKEGWMGGQRCLGRAPAGGSLRSIRRRGGQTIEVYQERDFVRIISSTEY